MMGGRRDSTLHGLRWLCRLGLAISLVATTPGCGGGGDGGDPTPTDLGTPDTGPPPDLGTDAGCKIQFAPECPSGSRAVQDPPVGECEGPWRCEECPPIPPEARCPLGQSHQIVDGCPSESLCDCSMPIPPRCPEGQVPQKLCDAAGKCCYTGGCGIDCPAVAPPECNVCQQETRDERGCLTGGCSPLPCGDMPEPDCFCGARPGRNPCGCLTGVCQDEPPACTVTEVPQCPDSKVPELTGNCLTGKCVTGACRVTCQQDSDCSSADACLVWAPGCAACMPKPCLDFRDCPNHTDCVAGHCQLRLEATCETDDDCDAGLICDALRCGACEPPCECLTNLDCAAGQLCRDCACVEGCRDDGGCTLPERCHVPTGECRGCACELDEECPAGEYCNGCFCAPGCRVSDECGPWQVCSGVTHQCEPDDNCTRRGDCRANQRCVDRHCTPEPGICAAGGEPCEPFFDDCSCDYVCSRQHDPRESCSRDCGGGPFLPPPQCLCTEQGCIIGRCDGRTSVDCPATYHCSKRVPGYELSEGVCREGRPTARLLCRVDADCAPEDCCRPTQCVRADSTECQSPIVCDAEEPRPEIVGCTCEDGVCRTAYRL